MADITYIPEDEEKEALGLLRDEIDDWKNGDIDITDSVSYTMRDEIKDARKNYYGKFDAETDTSTGLEKIFVPLTEWSVESMIKNIDLDTKDIMIKAPTQDKIGTAEVLRLIVQNFLKRVNFGESLNDIQRRTVIDGTAIVKVIKSYSDEYKRYIPDIRIVDFLNFYIDPAARNIQDASAVIEKNVVTMDEFYSMASKGKWNNVKLASPINERRFDADSAATGFSVSEVPIIEVYERWGKIDKSWVTKKEEDEDKWVDGIIIASGMETDGTPVIHKIAFNKKKIKPYEECWMRKTPARWAGRGIPEQLRGLQLYVNSTVNIRRNNALLIQNGIFKIRKGAGITQQNLTALKAGGAIPVDNMEDIEELRTGDIKASSYQDEQAIYALADRVAGTRELPTNDSMAPTTAVIQERDVKSAANMIQENVGFFLTRLFKRHIIPLIIESLEDRETLRITGDPETIKVFDDNIINYFVNNAVIDYYKRTGIYPTQQEIDLQKELARKKFQKMGSDRFIEIWKENFDVDYDADIVITEDTIDKAVVAKQLTDLLLVATKMPGTNLDIAAIQRQILDVLGLEGSQLTNKPTTLMAQGNELPNPGGQTPTPMNIQQATMPMGGSGR
jgi:hypothetical protein